MDSSHRLLLEKLAVARIVVNSDPVLDAGGLLWCDMATDNRIWVAEIIHQARADAAASIASLSARVLELELALHIAPPARP